MRIISGKFKNKKLSFPKNFKTRPLKDSVRENIFNILNHSNKLNIKIKNSIILDVYAGTGSFGLECISRDALRVFFVERDLDALKNLKKNITSLNCEDKTFLFSSDVLEFFKNLDLKLYKKKFNLVFLDPPYNDQKLLDVVKIIKKKEILDKKHILIIHREINSEKDIDKYINIIENRTYGRSQIFFGRVF